MFSTSNSHCSLENIGYARGSSSDVSERYVLATQLDSFITVVVQCVQQGIRIRYQQKFNN